MEKNKKQTALLGGELEIDILKGSKLADRISTIRTEILEKIRDKILYDYHYKKIYGIEIDLIYTQINSELQNRKLLKDLIVEVKDSIEVEVEVEV